MERYRALARESRKEGDFELAERIERQGKWLYAKGYIGKETFDPLREWLEENEQYFQALNLIGSQYPDEINVAATNEHDFLRHQPPLWCMLADDFPPHIKAFVQNTLQASSRVIVEPGNILRVGDVREGIHKPHFPAKSAIFLAKFFEQR